MKEILPTDKCECDSCRQYEYITERWASLPEVSREIIDKLILDKQSLEMDLAVANSKLSGIWPISNVEDGKRRLLELESARSKVIEQIKELSGQEFELFKTIERIESGS